LPAHHMCETGGELGQFTVAVAGLFS